MTDETESREEISDMGDVSRNLSNIGDKVKVVNQEGISIEDPFS
jgi:hypothetical protein